MIKRFLCNYNEKHVEFVYPHNGLFLSEEKSFCLPETKFFVLIKIIKITKVTQTTKEIGIFVYAKIFHSICIQMNTLL